MDINEYLYKHKIAVLDFAELVGVTPQYLSKIAHGKYKPSPKLIKWIIEASDGKITEQGLLNPGRKFCIKCGQRHTE